MRLNEDWSEENYRCGFYSPTPEAVANFRADLAGELSAIPAPLQDYEVEMLRLYREQEAAEAEAEAKARDERKP